jgi:hypothetical protein
MNEIGQIRPTQLIFTFGVASLVDLPNMSALVMGLDDWNTQHCREIEEDRLLATIQQRIHGSCCHACLFAPETSCERGNRYLDRSVWWAPSRAVRLHSLSHLNESKPD